MAVTPLREFIVWQNTLTIGRTVPGLRMVVMLRPLRLVLAHGHLIHEHLKADDGNPWWSPPVPPRWDVYRDTELF